MKKIIQKMTAPAILTFALFATNAMSQQAPSTAPGASSMSATSAKTHAQRKADAVEERITQLHSELKITDQQAKPWDNFAQTMRDNAQKASQAFHDRAQKLPTMNADDAMKSYADITQLHADNMKKLASAWSDLYAVLSTDQKQVADVLYRNQTLKSHQHSKHKQKSGAPASAASAPSN
jgi:protein CpxP